MSRFSRINIIWRKELKDTIRDRRTLIAMVLVPMVLYPALMIGSLQAVEMQVSFLVTEEYKIGVLDERAQAWLRSVIDRDRALLRAASEPAATEPAAGGAASASGRRGAEQSARAGVRENPPNYVIQIVNDVNAAIIRGEVHVGVLVDGVPPGPDEDGSARITVAYDDAEIRSQIASAGVAGILERANQRLLDERLKRWRLNLQFVQPLALFEQNVASSERLAGSVLGQIVPLILVLMTMTGAIYPAIDLTAGERERGTLETLMVAPVPTVDLIAGKFVVVTMIGLLSAALNLASVGGTIYLGGAGSLLTQGSAFPFPFHALPWILLLMVPLAVLFSAALLAVCSFARSFKEAQNYVLPVMMAAIIPGVVGILPGTRLEGPIIIMPVANIVVLARDLFLSKFDFNAILLVLLSTSLYAGAAVAIAAKLFGQEAVLFADSGSVATVFDRRFFRVRSEPSAAAAMLVLALVYSLNFYLQQAIARSPWLSTGIPYLNAIALTLIVLLAVGPWFAARYMRVDAMTAFALQAPPARAWLSAVCLGASTWILALAWWQWQQGWLPMDPNLREAIERQTAWFGSVPPWTLVFFLALVPAFTEELFFRGYVLSGMRGSVGKWGAVLLVSLAFGLFHYSAYRLGMTTLLGLLLALLAVQYRSIWPGMLAHLMHNTISTLAGREDGLAPLMRSIGFPTAADAELPAAWVGGAAALAAIGVAIALTARRAPGSINPSPTRTLPSA
ncbi:MAG: CPBP family intramembrane metalloprotease [Phycisphaerae bacterium]|jgi:ABC-2 type transport system permease protein/sodium transport system permease protein